MGRNPTALAWTVLLLSFFACIVLAFSVPAGVRWYIDGATAPNSAELEIIRGTALHQRAGDRAEVGVLNRQRLEEGDSVRTTGDTQAIVWLFDGSNIRLWPQSRLVLQSLRLSRYNNALTSISISLIEGHCRVEVGRPATESRRLEIVTPTATVLMREGSYSIEVPPAPGNTSTSIVTHNGSASVTAEGKTVEVLRAERTEVEAKQPPASPMPAARNLVRNGDFSQGLEVNWVLDSRAEDGVLAEVRPGLEDGRTLAQFSRAGSSKHGEAFLIQTVNQDVTDFESLTLNLEVKLINQSLSGGGWMGSEYPLMVRLRYRDNYQSEALWVRGFYFQNKDNHPTNNGLLVPHNVWHRFAKPFDLFDPAVVQPRPTYIVAIELVASGWDFESKVTDVQLVAE